MSPNLMPPTLGHSTSSTQSGTTVPFRTVLRYWWNLGPERPGTAWQYVWATAFYNSVIALVLVIFFLLISDHAQNVEHMLNTLLYSHCIGFSIHAGFECLHRFTTDTWRAELPRWVHQAIHLAIPIAGMFLGYTVAFAMIGKNFFTLLVRYPRVALVILAVGLAVSVVWYLIMDGQTRKLRALAQEALAREQAAALQKQASDAELRALQAQIEPHFLFNTLANVQALIDYEPQKAKQMLETFIEYLRATLDASRRTAATLGDELQMLERYLQLMQVRMGERLRYVWHVGPELRALPFAPLLLQPLVENAIKYGLEPKIEGGTVTIRATQAQGRITLTVQDDGRGLVGSSEGTGLRNVRARLQSVFGPSANVALVGGPEGCCVTLMFDAPK